MIVIIDIDLLRVGDIEDIVASIVCLILDLEDIYRAVKYKDYIIVNNSNEENLLFNEDIKTLKSIIIKASKAIAPLYIDIEDISTLVLII